MRPVITYPDGRLLKPCEPVQIGDPTIGALVEEMKKACQDEGAGLAANQIGDPRAVLIYRDKDGEFHALINPEIKDAVPVKHPELEGCLSLPGLNVRVFRSVEIVVQALNEKFEPVTLALEDIEARIVQHEIDHLSGKLIVDHLGILDRQLTLDKWMKKSRKLARMERAYRRVA